MADEPATTREELAREGTRATSANTQDRGYIPDQIDGNAQPDGLPSFDAQAGQVTQSPYDERGALANAGMPPATDDAPLAPPTGPGRADPRYQDPPIQAVPEQPGRPDPDTAQRNADRGDITTNH